MVSLPRRFVVAPEHPNIPLGIQPFDLIAAVGTNTGGSGVAEHSYVRGYGLAASQLFAALARSQRGRPSKADFEAAINVDAFIYPLAFCVRHYVELALKLATRESHALRAMTTPFDGRHTLRGLWPAFEDACRLDRRLTPFIDRMRLPVEQLDSLDPSGQMFRYRSDPQGMVHLQDVDLIHVRSFESTFQQLHPAIDELLTELDALAWEYSFGTYTARLSRSDLIEIAHAQRSAFDPLSPEWMRNFRSMIKRRYNLTNREFDDADATIEQLHYLSLLSGRGEVPLRELDAGSMSKILLGASAVLQGDDLLDHAEWAGLSAIVEIFGPHVGPEEYDRVVQAYLDGGIPIRRHDVARTILRRPGDFHFALLKLAQPTLAAAFIETWPLDPA